MTGTWKVGSNSYFRLDDQGETVTRVLVSSPAFSEAHGQLKREDTRFRGHLSVVYKDDSRGRAWTVPITVMTDDYQVMKVRLEVPTFRNGRKVGTRIENYLGTKTQTGRP